MRIFLQLLVASWHRKRQRQLLLLLLLLPVRTTPLHLHTSPHTLPPLAKAFHCVLHSVCDLLECAFGFLICFWGFWIFGFCMQKYALCVWHVGVAHGAAAAATASLYCCQIQFNCQQQYEVGKAGEMGGKGKTKKGKTSCTQTRVNTHTQSQMEALSHTHTYIHYTTVTHTAAHSLVATNTNRRQFWA